MGLCRKNLIVLLHALVWAIRHRILCCIILILVEFLSEHTITRINPAMRLRAEPCILVRYWSRWKWLAFALLLKCAVECLLKYIQTRPHLIDLSCKKNLITRSSFLFGLFKLLVALFHEHAIELGLAHHILLFRRGCHIYRYFLPPLRIMAFHASLPSWTIRQ